MREEIGKIKKKKQLRKLSETMSQFFVKSHKIDKYLARVTKI